MNLIAQITKAVFYYGFTFSWSFFSYGYYYFWRSDNYNELDTWLGQAA